MSARFVLFASLALIFTSCTKKSEEAPPPAPTVAAAAGPTFTLNGTVNFPTGSGIKVDSIKMSADPVCQKANEGKPTKSESLVVNPNKTLANVFVYVKEGAPASPAANLPAVEFDQRGCRYVPHVFGVRVNQPIKIINSDPTLHNVHAQASANPGFNAGMPSQGMTIEKKFTKPETMIHIKCDVHGWMGAYVGVLDHPFFAVTDDSGNFSIKDLPAGTYTLEAWHEKLGTKTQQLVVDATSAAKPLSFEF